MFRPEIQCDSGKEIQVLPGPYTWATLSRMEEFINP